MHKCVAKKTNLITGDAIEGMLIAPSAPAQHRLSPAAQLDACNSCA